MLRDASRQRTMMRAIDHGPGALPDGLLVGTRAAQYRALKAHANTISHARIVALEDSYPRTRELLGREEFHAAARGHLDAPETRSRPLRLIGAEFERVLDDPVLRDLARLEWAVLAAHGALDAPALLLGRLKNVAPEALVRAQVARHPATRLVALEAPDRLAWDGLVGDGDHVLVTRPHEKVLLRRIDKHVAQLAEIDAPLHFGRLLDRDAEAATMLVKAGALSPRILLS